MVTGDPASLMRLSCVVMAASVGRAPGLSATVNSKLAFLASMRDAFLWFRAWRAFLQLRDEWPPVYKPSTSNQREVVAVHVRSSGGGL